MSLTIPLIAQKVSYKKGTISVNKKAQFRVDKTKKGRLVGLSNYALRTIEGDDILTVKDTAFYLAQLPNEEEPRVSFRAYVVTAPSLDKTTIVPIIGALNFGKRLMNDLKATSFFKGDGLTEEIYNNYVKLHKSEEIPIKLSEIDSINTFRQENYKLTKKIFGPLLKRRPGNISISSLTIKEGIEKIGSLKLKEKGSYASTYKVINKAGDIIGGYSIIPSEGKSNVRLMVDEGNWKTKRKWFYHKEGTTLEQMMKRMATFLVEAGYL